MTRVLHFPVEEEKGVVLCEALDNEVLHINMTICDLRETFDIFGRFLMKRHYMS